VYNLLRVLMAIWVVGFLVIACGPLVIGANNGLGGFAVGGLFSALLSTALFVPWIVGVVILAFLIYLTRPPRRRY
jgi:hypothetical protein